MPYNHQGFLWIADGWWNLDPLWSEIELRASMMKKMWKGHAVHTPWGREGGRRAAVIGEAGEYAFALATNYPPAPMADRSPQHSDAGIDFVLPGDVAVDVKASPHWKNPYLKSPASRDRLIEADVLVLVGVDYDGRRARLFGWATREELLSAPVVGPPTCPDEPAHLMRVKDLRFGTPDARAGVVYEIAGGD